MKIKKVVFREHIEPADLVSKKDQKLFLGGYGGGSGCCYSEHWSIPTTYPCSDQGECDRLAGPYGWWCCNCAGCQ